MIIIREDFKNIYVMFVQIKSGEPSKFIVSYLSIWCTNLKARFLQLTSNFPLTYYILEYPLYKKESDNLYLKMLSYGKINSKKNLCMACA